MPKIKIEKEIRDCQECPIVQDSHGGGDTVNYHCPVLRRNVGYQIEYRSEMPNIPKDCPYLVK